MSAPAVNKSSRRARSAGTVPSFADARRRPRRRRLVLCLVLAVVVGALLAVNILLGSYTVTVPDFLRMVNGQRIPGASFIVMDNKLPRALTALMVGACFGIAGAVFQTMLRNPLASPDIIGISYGASASAVLAIVFLGASGLAISAAAIGGAVVVAALISWLSRSRGGSGLILSGIGVAAFLQALVTFLLQRSDVRTAQEALVWLVGSLNASNWSRTAALALGLLVLLPVAALLSRNLQALQLGEDTATALGHRVRFSRAALTLLGVLLAAIATAAAGPVAFVAFLSAPIARRLNAGASSLLVALLVGAAIVLGADFLAANLLPHTALPVGVVTGALGAPFLLWLLASTNRNGHGG
ncbi:MAG: enterobactin transporter permease [Micrococcaceae bacterium]|nr:enterobactin transporter permease [Micrococcaceae bacterium]